MRAGARKKATWPMIGLVLRYLADQSQVAISTTLLKALQLVLAWFTIYDTPVLEVAHMNTYPNTNSKGGRITRVSLIVEITTCDWSTR